MNSALFLSHAQQYKGRVVSEYLPCYHQISSNASKLVRSILTRDAGLNIASSLYFGDEFCEHKLLSLQEMRTFSEIAKEEGLRAVLVTPPSTNYGLNKIAELIDGMRCTNDHFSVVVNDIGVAEMLRLLFPDIKLAGGRLLDKTSREARVDLSSIVGYYGAEGLQFAKTPSISSRHYRDAFKDVGITSFGFDLPKTGLSLEQSECRLSLYWPFGFLTTGRVCRHRGVRPDSYFPTEERPCPRLCQGSFIELCREKSEHGEPLSSPIFQQGNTLFSLLSDSSAIGHECFCFNEVVFQLPG